MVMSPAPGDVLLEGALGLPQDRDELSERGLGLLHGLGIELGIQAAFELSQATAQLTDPVQDADCARGVPGNPLQQWGCPVGELVHPVHEFRGLRVQLGDSLGEGLGAAGQGAGAIGQGSRSVREAL